MSIPPQRPIIEHDRDARTWAMLCHLLAIFASAIGPLIVWLIKKDDYQFVDLHGRESLNFQISILIYAAASTILICTPIGILLVPAVGIFSLVCTIIACVQAYNGQEYRYPLSIRIIS